MGPSRQKILVGKFPELKDTFQYLDETDVLTDEHIANLREAASRPAAGADPNALSIVRDNLPGRLGYDIVPTQSAGKATAKSKTKGNAKSKAKGPAPEPLRYRLSKSAITKLNKVVKAWVDKQVPAPENVTFVAATKPGKPWAINEDQWPRFLAAFSRHYDARVKGNGELDLVDVAQVAATSQLGSSGSAGLPSDSM